jgi:uncharacterized membrane protein
MRKLVLVAVLGIFALGAVAVLVIYWQTQPPITASAIPAEPPAPAVAVPVEPTPASAASPPDVPPPDAPERGRAIPAGDLQVKLESADPEERREALGEARNQRRAGMMDWLNRNTARRAAAAPQR